MALIDEIPSIGDKKAWSDVTQALLEHLNMKDCVDLRKSLPDTARELPPLTISTDTDKKDKTMEIVDDGNVLLKVVYDKDLADPKKMPTAVTGRDGVTWKKDGDKWLATDKDGKQIKGTDGKQITADKVEVSGTEADTTVTIKQGDKTTVQRLDGSSITEKTARGDSSHMVVKDADGNVTKVIHNNQEFKIKDGKVIGADGRTKEGYTFDKETSEIQFKKGSSVITLKEDGRTELVSKTGEKIIGFGDGSRIYQDKDNKVVGLRESNGNMVRPNSDGTWQVTKNGKPVPDHVLNGKKVDSVDSTTGAVTLKDVPAGGKQTIKYLDHEVVKTTGGLIEQMKDSKGVVYDFKYDGAKNIKSITPLKADGTAEDTPIFEKSPKIGVVVDEKKGLVSITNTATSEVVKYDLAERSRESTWLTSEKKFADGRTEHRDLKTGRLEALEDKLGNGSELTYGTGAERSKITNYKHPSGQKYEVGVDGVKRIDVKNGIVTIEKETEDRKSVQISYKPDGSVETSRTDGSKVIVQLDRFGRPGSINDGDKKYTINYETAPPALSLDGKEINKGAAVTATPEGTIKIEKAEETITIDPLRRSETRETGAEKVERITGADKTLKSEVTIRKEDGKPVSAEIKGPDGKVAYTAKIDSSKPGPPYTVTEIRDGTGKLVAKASASVELSLDSDRITAKITAKSGEHTVTLNPDKSREIKFPDNHTERRLPGGWISEYRSPDGKTGYNVEYEKNADGSIKTARGQAVPKEITFKPSGYKLEHQEDLLSGTSKLILHKDGAAPEELKSMTIDRRGIIHVETALGKREQIGVKGDKLFRMPEEAAPRTDVPPPPGRVRPRTETAEAPPAGSKMEMTVRDSVKMPDGTIVQRGTTPDDYPATRKIITERDGTTSIVESRRMPDRTIQTVVTDGRTGNTNVVTTDAGGAVIRIEARDAATGQTQVWQQEGRLLRNGLWYGNRVFNGMVNGVPQRDYLRTIRLNDKGELEYTNRIGQRYIAQRDLFAPRRPAA